MEINIKDNIEMIYLPDGIGLYTYLNKEEYQGYFQNGNKEGYGTFLYSNGDIFEGKWKNNKKNGKGVMFYKSEQEEKGKWKDDELQLSFFTKLANLFETKK